MLPGLSTDDFVASLTIWREASGEPYLGKIGVAEVIKNRGKERNLRPLDVCFQRLQFSCHNPNDPNNQRWPTPKIENGTIAWPNSFLDSLKAWKEVLAGKSSVYGANHYHTISIAPKWADRRKIVGTIGNHVFYKL